MEYNTQRSKMSISEYGRNIQKMIEGLQLIEDREKRNQQARAIIQVMGQLNPHLRDVNDFKHKLWDHLFIMSDFKLDVDSPYPIPSAEILERKPEKLKYAENHIKFKHYGRHIERIIEKACEMEEGEERDYHDWVDNGCLMPPPHKAKQMVLKEYAGRYNADTLIETGTFFGDMVNA
ncbi:MAG: DUF4290 domain-containing protein, partial [Candidatus Moranbacteria bacterium]|nr:DUF4290 domain-containing protein [Candidatus Moranbacteria bacterium]